MKRSFPTLILILSFVSVISCSFRRNEIQKEEIPCLKRVVILGFRPVSPIFKGSSYVRCPISNNTFRGERVSEDVTATMTNLFLKHISNNKYFEIVMPQMVENEFLDLYQVIDNTRKKEILLNYIRQIGLAFDADAVLLGHVFRWEERVGSDFSAIKPASVSFDLHLIETEKGKVVWTEEFDKTQRSLSENLLEIKTFIKGKARWLTAKGLADIGISEMVKKLLKTQRKCEK
ncbi:MAG: hypothetical protein DRG27_02385 [Deltaproteobacteria bacterium]|nr:MAG: hypothetical protein DRG27_02385 [Deltaproteobacteria bacterium]